MKAASLYKAVVLLSIPHHRRTGGPLLWRWYFFFLRGLALWLALTVIDASQANRRLCTRDTESRQTAFSFVFLHTLHFLHRWRGEYEALTFFYHCARATIEAYLILAFFFFFFPPKPQNRRKYDNFYFWHDSRCVYLGHGVLQSGIIAVFDFSPNQLFGRGLKLPN